MKLPYSCIAAAALLASGAVLADGRPTDGQITAQAPTPMSQAQTDTAKAPVRLSEEQMEKVVAGGLTLITLGNDINSCNSGKCYYVNPNGDPVGKPVTGFNN